MMLELTGTELKDQQKKYKNKQVFLIPQGSKTDNKLMTINTATDKNVLMMQL